jgi:hypothetical protein
MMAKKIEVGILDLPVSKVSYTVQALADCLIGRGFDEAEVKEALLDENFDEDAFWMGWGGPAVDALGEALGFEDSDEE